MYIVVFVSSLTTLQAQNPARRQRADRPQPTVEERQTRQRDRIVRELALDDATAARFADLYRQYQEEMRAALPAPPRQKPADATTADKSRKVKPNPTDEEVDKAIRQRFARQRTLLDIREKYYDKFREILSPKQVQKMYTLEKKNAPQGRRPGALRPGQQPRRGGKALQQRQA